MPCYELFVSAKLRKTVETQSSSYIFPLKEYRAVDQCYLPLNCGLYRLFHFALRVEFENDQTSNITVREINVFQEAGLQFFSPVNI